MQKSSSFTHLSRAHVDLLHHGAMLLREAYERIVQQKITSYFEKITSHFEKITSFFVWKNITASEKRHVSRFCTDRLHHP